MGIKPDEMEKYLVRRNTPMTIHSPFSLYFVGSEVWTGSSHTAAKSEQGFQVHPPGSQAYAISTEHQCFHQRRMEGVFACTWTPPSLSAWGHLYVAIWGPHRTSQPAAHLLPESPSRWWKQMSHLSSMWRPAWASSLMRMPHGSTQPFHSQKRQCCLPSSLLWNQSEVSSDLPCLFLNSWWWSVAEKARAESPFMQISVISVASGQRGTLCFSDARSSNLPSDFIVTLLAGSVHTVPQNKFRGGRKGGGGEREMVREGEEREWLFKLSWNLSPPGHIAGMTRPSEEGSFGANLLVFWSSCCYSHTGNFAWRKRCDLPEPLFLHL